MKILNFGSMNIDFTYRLPHIVEPGETITSESLQIFPGGKGLNQSIALARAGMDVYHAGCIGEDGEFLADLCRENHIHTEYIKKGLERTGNAVIQVSDSGQNCIILYPGANRSLTRQDVDHVFCCFEPGDILLLQNEINQLSYIMRRASEKGMKIFLNPSPYDACLEECPLEKVHTFILNEVEGWQMTGEEEETAILDAMRQKFPQAGTVLTLGDKGAYYDTPRGRDYMPAMKVKAVDTTAAGDTFTGYFMSEILSGASGRRALETAARASAIAVMRKGASSSIPVRKEVDSFRF